MTSVKVETRGFTEQKHCDDDTLSDPYSSNKSRILLFKQCLILHTSIANIMFTLINKKHMLSYLTSFSILREYIP